MLDAGRKILDGEIINHGLMRIIVKIVVEIDILFLNLRFHKIPMNESKK